MNLHADDEILQDFLVEASEIVELLGEQLVDLEQRPDDSDLLNAIFRGFHTVKGGAGFLAITPLVEICHRAEDVFNVLRQGQRSVTPELMDSILQALDVVNDSMDTVRDGDMPAPADRELLVTLEALAREEGADAGIAATSQDAQSRDPVAAAQATSGDGTGHAGEIDVSAPDGDDISEEEFEALLDELHGKGKHGSVRSQAASPDNAKPVSDEITDDEFEALLDDLHGSGRHGGKPDRVARSRGAQSGSEQITDDEFESLLDDLHGKGKHGGVPAGDNQAAKTQPPSADEITADEFASLLDESHGKREQGSVPAGNKDDVVVGQAKIATPPPASGSAASTTAQAGASVAEPELPSAPTKPKRADSGRAQSKAPTAETTVRVDTQRLDEIMNMVGELVLVRNRLATLKSTLADEELANAVGNLDVVTADLQLSVMKTRMQPVKKVFGRFPRVVRDLARNLKKEVDLELIGEDTDLDKNLVEALSDPMVHLVRNAVDHGIESPEEREQAGKPRRGKVVLAAAQEGDYILLSIDDDGKGMDAEVLRRKAVEKGMMDEEAAARLDDKECYNLILHAGFSTKTEISDVSGRGVGMDVVKTRIAQMNGSVEIDSAKGKGSKIIIKLPLTLAILPTLMVILGDQPFALPLSSVVEIFNLDRSRTNTVDGQLTIRVRDRALPLFYLRNWLTSHHDGADELASQHVVVVNVNSVQVGLVVDFLVGQEEVVIKPLGALLQGLDGMAGATITGDGKIALILDVPGLMRKYARR